MRGIEDSGVSVHGGSQMTEHVPERTPETVLRAPLVIEYPFRRTTGPVIGAFLTGLRERVVLGIRAVDGRVLCPPVEYDPADASPLSELVRVADEGEVLAAAGNLRPAAEQPNGGPGSWALVRLDGADTAMLHAVDAEPHRLPRGTRVRVRWAEERTGSITDIACFEPVEDGDE